MKRGTLLKALFGVAFAMLMANGIFAQIPADYTAISGDQAAEIDSVTVGSTTGYWVLPDPYYNPDFTSTGALGTNTQWNWNLNVNPGGASFVAPGTDTVYMEVSWDAAGLHEITVNEELTSGAGCTSSDTMVWVRVIDSTTVTYSPTAAGIIGADITVCEGDAQLADIVQAAITSEAGNSPSVQLLWTLQITTLQADQTTINNYWRSDKTAFVGTGLAYNYDNGAQITGINAATYDLAKPDDGLYTSIVDGGNKATTVYTYTLNGVNDRISRKSDYLTNSGAALTSWSWYDTTAETITITVNPAPETGPIYHIPNDWAN